MPARPIPCAFVFGLGFGVAPRLIWRPLFAYVRKTEGFKDLVRDLGLAEFWRTTGKWGEFARAVGEDDFEIIR